MVRARAPGVRRRARASPPRAAPDLAGRSIDADARRRQRQSAGAAADARRRRSAGAALARRPLGAGGGLMARKTSFYYSFLVLPADQRRAIVTVWDFCRAVDDAVDEEPGGDGLPTGREAVSFWRQELAAVYEHGEPRTPQARALQPFVRAFDLPRQAFADVIDGVT